MITNKKNNKGSILVFTIAITTVFVVFLSGMISVVIMQQKSIRQKVSSERSLHIAEAGINYYRWHLSHAINDYADGTGEEGCDPCGPYEHNYSDPWGSDIGKFAISIIPPTEGSDVVVLQSTGWLNNNPSQKRKIEVTYQRPSLVKYMVAANANIRFGEDTDVYGEIHSNGGIRFDGVAHNIVSSARETYTDPDGAGLCGASPNENICPGVWTSLAEPNEVFLAGTNFPAPAIDFEGITADLANLKKLALNNAIEQVSRLWIGDGIYLEPSDKQGYLLQFKVVSGNTLVDIKRVKKTSECELWWGDIPTHEVSQTNTVATNIAMPSNGIIFVEDHVWVEGEILDTGLTVVAAKFPNTPSTNKDIYINNDMVYAGNYDTNKLTTTLGLIAQKDISIGLYSEDDLEIHAALLAQTGRIGREYYSNNCDNNYYKRDTITVRGTLATNGRYGFSWTCGYWCSGYHYRNLIFNDQLRISPPPHYPVVGEYTFLSWKEINAN